MSDTTESTPAVAEPAVADLLARARVYVEGSHAKQTLEAYAADWKHFSTWCEEHKRRPLPAAPETMALRADAKRQHLLLGGDG
jgi:site-specific recombinase XerD